MLAYGLAVLAGGVALVASPAILRALVVEGVHIVVAEGLGQNAGGGDGLVFAVALDDGGVGQGAVGLEAVAVDDYGFGSYAELVQGGA